MDPDLKDLFDAYVKQEFCEYSREERSGFRALIKRLLLKYIVHATGSNAHQVHLLKLLRACFASPVLLNEGMPLSEPLNFRLDRAYATADGHEAPPPPQNPTDPLLHDVPATFKEEAPFPCWVLTHLSCAFFLDNHLQLAPWVLPCYKSIFQTLVDLGSPVTEFANLLADYIAYLVSVVNAGASEQPRYMVGIANLEDFPSVYSSRPHQKVSCSHSRVQEALGHFLSIINTLVCEFWESRHKAGLFTVLLHSTIPSLLAYGNVYLTANVLCILDTMWRQLGELSCPQALYVDVQQHTLVACLTSLLLLTNEHTTPHEPDANVLPASEPPLADPSQPSPPLKLQAALEACLKRAAYTLAEKPQLAQEAPPRLLDSFNFSCIFNRRLSMSSRRICITFLVAILSPHLRNNADMMMSPCVLSLFAHAVVSFPHQEMCSAVAPLITLLSLALSKLMQSEPLQPCAQSDFVTPCHSPAAMPSTSPRRAPSVEIPPTSSTVANASNLPPARQAASLFSPVRTSEGSANVASRMPRAPNPYPSTSNWPPSSLREAFLFKLRARIRGLFLVSSSSSSLEPPGVASRLPSAAPRDSKKARIVKYSTSSSSSSSSPSHQPPSTPSSPTCNVSAATLPPPTPRPALVFMPPEAFLTDVSACSRCSPMFQQGPENSVPMAASSHGPNHHATSSASSGLDANKPGGNSRCHAATVEATDRCQETNPHKRAKAMHHQCPSRTQQLEWLASLLFEVAKRATAEAIRTMSNGIKSRSTSLAAFQYQVHALHFLKTFRHVLPQSTSNHHVHTIKLFIQSWKTALQFLSLDDAPETTLDALGAALFATLMLRRLLQKLGKQTLELVIALTALPWFMLQSSASEISSEVYMRALATLGSVVSVSDLVALRESRPSLHNNAHWITRFFVCLACLPALTSASDSASFSESTSKQERDRAQDAGASSTKQQRPRPGTRGAVDPPQPNANAKSSAISACDQQCEALPQTIFQHCLSPATPDVYAIQALSVLPIYLFQCEAQGLPNKYGLFLAYVSRRMKALSSAAKGPEAEDAHRHDTLARDADQRRQLRDPTGSSRPASPQKSASHRGLWSTADPSVPSGERGQQEECTATDNMASALAQFAKDISTVLLHPETRLACVSILPLVSSRHDLLLHHPAHWHESGPLASGTSSGYCSSMFSLEKEKEEEEEEESASTSSKAGRDGEMGDRTAEKGPLVTETATEDGSHLGEVATTNDSPTQATFATPVYSPFALFLLSTQHGEPNATVRPDGAEVTAQSHDSSLLATSFFSSSSSSSLSTTSNDLLGNWEVALLEAQADQHPGVDALVSWLGPHQPDHSRSFLRTLTLAASTHPVEWLCAVMRPEIQALYACPDTAPPSFSASASQPQRANNNLGKDTEDRMSVRLPAKNPPGDHQHQQYNALQPLKGGNGTLFESPTKLAAVTAFAHQRRASACVQSQSPVCTTLQRPQWRFCASQLAKLPVDFREFIALVVVGSAPVRERSLEAFLAFGKLWDGLSNTPTSREWPLSPFIQLLADPSFSVRRKAALCLGTIARNVACDSALVTILKKVEAEVVHHDHSLHVTEAAVVALGEMLPYASTTDRELFLVFLVKTMCRGSTGLASSALNVLFHLAAQEATTVVDIIRPFHAVLAQGLAEALPEFAISDAYSRVLFNMSRQQFFRQTLNLTLPHIIKNQLGDSLVALSHIISVKIPLLLVQNAGRIFSSVFMEVSSRNLQDTLDFFETHAQEDTDTVVFFSTQQILYNLALEINPEDLEKKKDRFRHALEILMQHFNGGHENHRKQTSSKKAKRASASPPSTSANLPATPSAYPHQLHRKQSRRKKESLEGFLDGFVFPILTLLRFRVSDNSVHIRRRALGGFMALLTVISKETLAQMRIPSLRVLMTAIEYVPLQEIALTACEQFARALSKDTLARVLPQLIIVALKCVKTRPKDVAKVLKYLIVEQMPLFTRTCHDLFHLPNEPEFFEIKRSLNQDTPSSSVSAPTKIFHLLSALEHESPSVRRLAFSTLEQLLLNHAESFTSMIKAHEASRLHHRHVSVQPLLLASISDGRSRRKGSSGSTSEGSSSVHKLLQKSNTSAMAAPPPSSSSSASLPSALAMTSQGSEIITRVLSSLLNGCRDADATIRRRSARCLSLVGANDPAQIGPVPLHAKSNKDFYMSIDSPEFGAHFVTEYVVRGLLSAKDRSHEDHAALALQECLKAYQCTPDLPVELSNSQAQVFLAQDSITSALVRRRSRSSSSSKSASLVTVVHEGGDDQGGPASASVDMPKFWTLLDDNTRSIAHPFLKSHYVWKAQRWSISSEPGAEGPLFPRRATFKVWIYDWTLTLLKLFFKDEGNSKVSGGGPSASENQRGGKRRASRGSERRAKGQASTSAKDNQPSLESRLFRSCHGLIVDNVDTCMYLVPYLVRTIVVENQGSLNDLIVQELQAVFLQAPDVIIHRNKYSKLAVSLAFAVVENLERWATQYRYTLVSNSNGGRHRRTNLNSAALPPSLKHVEAFLLKMPVDAMAHAAFTCDDHCRALKYLEAYMLSIGLGTPQSVAEAASALHGHSPSSVTLSDGNAKAPGDNLSSSNPAAHGGRGDQSSKHQQQQQQKKQHAVATGLGASLADIRLGKVLRRRNSAGRNEHYRSVQRTPSVFGRPSIPVSSSLSGSFLDASSASFALDSHFDIREPQAPTADELRLEWNACMTFLQQIYSKLSSPDAMDGVACTRTETSLDERILDHSSAGDWTAALTCYEEALRRLPGDPEYHRGILECQMNLGHLENTFITATELASEHPLWKDDLDLYRLEVAWKLGKWDDLSSTFSSSTSPLLLPLQSMIHTAPVHAPHEPRCASSVVAHPVFGRAGTFNDFCRHRGVSAPPFVHSLQHDTEIGQAVSPSRSLHPAKATRANSSPGQVKAPLFSPSFRSPHSSAAKGSGRPHFSLHSAPSPAIAVAVGTPGRHGSLHAAGNHPMPRLSTTSRLHSNRNEYPSPGLHEPLTPLSRFREPSSPRKCASIGDPVAVSTDPTILLEGAENEPRRMGDVSVMSKPTSRFDGMFGPLFIAAIKRDHPSFVSCLHSIRESAIKPLSTLSSAASDSYAQAYPSLLRLQMLQEFENVALEFIFVNKVSLQASTIQELGQRWKKQFACTRESFHERERILAMRRSLLTLIHHMHTSATDQHYHAPHQQTQLSTTVFPGNKALSSALLRHHVGALRNYDSPHFLGRKNVLYQLSHCLHPSPLAEVPTLAGRASFPWGVPEPQSPSLVGQGVSMAMRPVSLTAQLPTPLRSISTASSRGVGADVLTANNGGSSGWVHAVTRLKAELWIESAKLAQGDKLFDTAYNALLQSQAEVALPEVQMLLAQLHWDKGHHEDAMRTLRRHISSTDDEASRFKAKCLEIQWLGKTSRIADTEVETMYQQLISESTGEANQEMSEATEQLHYELAKYMDDLIKAPVAAVDADTFTAQAKKEERWLHSVIYHYGQSLIKTERYMFQALPRLLTLWLEYGSRFPTTPLGAASLGKKSRKSRSSKSSSAKSKAGEPSALPKNEELFGNINRTISQLIDRIPEGLFMSVLPHLTSRICHPNEQVFSLITKVLVRLLKLYQQQTLWMMMALTKSKQSLRRRRQGEVIKAAERQLAPLPKSYRCFVSLLDNLLEICERPVPQDIHSLSIRKDFPRLLRESTSFRETPFDGIIVPTTAAMTVGGGTIHTVELDTLPRIYKFSDRVQLMSSLQRPRKVEIIGSDGESYMFLCKPDDDLRKDNRIMDLNSMINKLLRGHPASRERQLHIRTYAVTPLSPTCGIIEWINNMTGFRTIISKIYKSKGLYATVKEVKVLMHPRTYSSAMRPEEIFEKKVLKRFPPVFGDWFVSSFPEATHWYSARLAYARTTAVMSIVGFILGLGDRHGENIMFDSTNGETMHVDFNCLFDKGLSFNVRECVPFRLTNNMVGALGVTGYEGVFRKTCEVTLRLMRQEEDSLINVLETLVYDPLVEWKDGTEGMSEKGQQKIRVVTNKVRGFGRAQRSIALSVEGQIDTLIREATSPVNLCRMYIGWAPYM